IFFLLGKGPNYATALEGALKLKETCNVFAEGFATREFLHGPIQLVDEKSLIFIVLPKNEINDTIGLIRILRKFGAQIVLLSEKKDILKDSKEMYVPEGFPKIFSPILYIIPLQLFSYYSSVARGLNPDNPKKLTKIVK
ncbi:MAG: SIS domain-containing protein, partial [Candidatus Baldrarchaeia archaeon]